ncbi:MAG TPA: hypothetical protein VMR44_01640 [Thermoanaerobaculia bacterium]|nr:hypothetical protein [Thermoanaerobaculia bacterium]
MRRRILPLTALLTVLYPLAARATSAQLDPDGNPVTSAALDWLDSVFRAFLALLGV